MPLPRLLPPLPPPQPQPQPLRYEQGRAKVVEQREGGRLNRVGV